VRLPRESVGLKLIKNEAANARYESPVLLIDLVRKKVEYAKKRD
jgi:hypothetical protein